MYEDFFDTPAGIPKRLAKSKPTPLQQAIEKEPLQKRVSKVRFHEEVKVKLVKSRRNPTSLLDLEDDDSDSDELPSFDEGWDDEDEDEDVNEDEELTEESEEGTDEEDDEGFDTIERTKDDLFAEEETPETGQ